MYILLYLLVGWKALVYLLMQRKKPKFHKMYYSSDIYTDKARQQELEFDDWNMQMRLCLESYYRFSFVLCFSFWIQTLMIVAFLLIGMTTKFKITLGCLSLFFIFTLWTAARLLSIKNTAKNRTWRKQESFIITEHINPATSIDSALGIKINRSLKSPNRYRSSLKNQDKRLTYLREHRNNLSREHKFQQSIERDKARSLKEFQVVNSLDKISINPRSNLPRMAEKVSLNKELTSTEGNSMVSQESRLRSMHSRKNQ